MPIFTYKDEEALGAVRSVDTSTVIVSVKNVELLRQLQVNRLVALESSRAGQHLIGIVQKITRVRGEVEEVAGDGEAEAEAPPEENLVRITLIGTFLDKLGKEVDVFRRTLDTVPEIEANCFPIEKERLTKFMQSVSQVSGAAGTKLALGHYTLDEKAEAILNGNKFFQRHALVVGSTGSGKSWTTANIIEQAAKLANTNAVVFDIHGEYGPLIDDGIAHFRVAGTGDLDKKATLAEGVIFLPFWLLTYEDMVSIFVDRSDQNAPNQSMTLSRAVITAKRKYLESKKQKEVLANFTVDSPVPYSLDDVLTELKALNTEMVEGSGGREKQGEFHGRLSRFIARLENKRTDRRLGFMFSGGKESDDWDWLPKLAKALMAGRRDQDKKKGGIKIVDFSEVPSDILPLVIGLVARLIFSVQQWSKTENRQPIALFCDEAHLYLPNRADTDSAASAALGTFERIAKEGRKYGVGLVVISQRPSEVSRTVLSQCNNVLSMRLTNGEDQEVVKRLLPDSLGGFSELLPILDKGEAIVVGDASILPSRIRISEPKMRPNSATIDFWDRWAEDKKVEEIAAAVQSLRRQSQN